MTVYACCSENRIAHVEAHPTINGIRYLEVIDNEAQPATERQRRLIVHFIRPIDPPLTKDNFVIEGGIRIRNIQVIDVQIGTTGSTNTIATLLLDQAGDFSYYTLHVVDPISGNIPDGYDKILSSIEFSFKINCLKDFDCIEDIPGFARPLPEPDISYLAKDFLSFRQLMLDRMAVTIPDWDEGNASDFGMMMVEMLAYVGDQLSEFQDIVATESTLATARNRISVRRHCQLVDYHMHDGCNARTWVFLEASAEETIPQQTQLLTYVPGVRGSIAIATSTGLSEYRNARNRGAIVFETMHTLHIFPEHNEMPFYTWGDTSCCLEVGTNEAVLFGHFPNLAIGDLILLEEIRGEKTGTIPDANPHKRFVIRLTDVQLDEDPLGGVFTDGFEPDEPVPITLISWDKQDALPFMLCISNNNSSRLSIARGNIALADHGERINRDDLGAVPASVLAMPPEQEDRCDPEDLKMIPPRFRPVLMYRPLTHATPYNLPLLKIEGSEVSTMVAQLDSGTLPDDILQAIPNRYASPLPPELSVQRTGKLWLVTLNEQRTFIVKENDTLTIYDDYPVASGLLHQNAADAEPSISLNEVTTARIDGSLIHEQAWHPTRTLINTNKTTMQFVVEIDNEQRAFLRFGDDQYGKRPEPTDNPTDFEQNFIAAYRVGNGKTGNIGAETLAHIVTTSGTPLSVRYVRNPLPAYGGTEPESMEEARQTAPVAFRKQERAVTPKDYSEIMMRHPLVQRAVARFRWVGSWYAVFITIDLVGGIELTPGLETELVDFIENYRMAAHDIEINVPIYVPLEIEMYVCVDPNYPQRIVRHELLSRFNNGLQADGRKGVFHPDNFTFGQTIYLSPLYAEAMTIEGIENLEIRVFQRQNAPDSQALDTGKMVLRGREIARLDNDPNFPMNGVFRLIMEGGR